MAHFVQRTFAIHVIDYGLAWFRKIHQSDENVCWHILCKSSLLAKGVPRR